MVTFQGSRLPLTVFAVSRKEPTMQKLYFAAYYFYFTGFGSDK